MEYYFGQVDNNARLLIDRYSEVLKLIHLVRRLLIRMHPTAHPVSAGHNLRHGDEGNSLL